MKAEEKANEIAENNLKWYYEEGNSYDECYQSALEAMQWKDEQHEQEKQQWIDKACEWICNNLCYYDENGFDSNGDGILKQFKQAMEE